MATDTTAEIVDKYTQLRPTYEQFATRVAELLRTLMESAGVRYHAIEHRSKDVDSFKQKIRRPEKTYANPLEEVTDLAGVRVIVYYLEDVDRVSNLVRDNFAISTSDSGDKGALLRANEFGYRSVHHVATLSESRSRLPEWRRFADLVAEIQVRTVLQHAWAAISHSLQYKAASDPPAKIARRLFRLSGLLELADEEFLVISQEQRAISADVANAISVGALDIPIDRTSASEYIEHADTPKVLAALAARAGFAASPPDAEFAEPRDYAGDLVMAAQTAGLRSIEELDRVCADSLPKALSYFSTLREQIDKPWSGTPSFFIQLAIILRRRNQFSVQQLVEQGWSEDIAKRVLDTAAQFGAG